MKEATRLGIGFFLDIIVRFKAENVVNLILGIVIHFLTDWEVVDLLLDVAI